MNLGWIFIPYILAIQGMEFICVTLQNFVCLMGWNVILQGDEIQGMILKQDEGINFYQVFQQLMGWYFLPQRCGLQGVFFSLRYRDAKVQSRTSIQTSNAQTESKVQVRSSPGLDLESRFSWRFGAQEVGLNVFKPTLVTRGQVNLKCFRNCQYQTFQKGFHKQYSHRPTHWPSVAGCI
jgi:hypothetical protein